MLLIQLGVISILLGISLYEVLKANDVRFYWVGQLLGIEGLALILIGVLLR